MAVNEQDIFLSVVELPPGERDAYLARVCRDPFLRQRVEQLLEFHDQDRTFLIEPFDGTEIWEVPVLEGPGELVGRYKLLEQIGEGGFGVVYMAEQSEPVRRRVALKIIKLGMDTKHVIGRFEAERQALALMEHPNIAKVFDGGTSQSGRPYFVMELVNGIPITTFCDRLKLSTRERLELAVAVCRAVQHAHQKGVIHRDLKPSNVLVTLQDDKPVPKVIDFGIAKATQQRLTERTVFTRFQHFLGTPAYMSPEQAAFSGVDVDTRSDVYSLGVLLYELITGSTPLQEQRLRAAGFDEVCRLIREDPAPPPSTRLSTLGKELDDIAEKRRSQPRDLRQTVNGELDWIVMKAIEKERVRRYESASALAADIERFLRHEPVFAAPPSLAYRVRKHIQRRWPLVLTVATITSSLLLGLIFSTLGFLAARREAGIASSARAVAEQAQLDEEVARKRAEAEAERNHNLLYASRVNLAGKALDSGNVDYVERLLTDYSPIGEDLRSFPWHYMMRQCQLYDAKLEHGSPVHAVQYTPDGTALVSVGEEGRANLWDLATRQARSLDVSVQTIMAIVFSPDGQTLAIGGGQGLGRKGEGRVELWNWQQGVHKGNIEIEEADGMVWSLSFSPDGESIAIGCLHNALVHDLRARTVTWRQHAVADTLRNNGRHVAFTSSVNVLALGYRDTVEIWNVALGETVKVFEGLGQIRDMAVSPDGKTVAVGLLRPKGEQVLKLLHLEENRNVTSRESDPGFPVTLAIESVAFSPDGQLLVTGNWSGLIELWDVNRLARAGTTLAHSNAIGGVTFSPDGRRVASGGHDRTVKIWDVDKNRTPESRATGHGGVVSWYAFSPDNRSVVSVGAGSIKRWNVTTGVLEREFRHQGGLGLRATLSSHDAQLAAAFGDGRVVLWDSKTASLIHDLEGPTDSPLFLIFSDDGRKLIVGGADESNPTHFQIRIREWDVATGKVIQTRVWPGIDVTRSYQASRPGYPHYRVFAGAFQDRARLSPDANLLAIGYGSDLLMWDLPSGRLLHTFKGQEHVIIPVTFSEDGKLLACSGQSQSIHVWNVVTRERAMSFEGQTWVGVMAFSPDRTTLATGYYDGRIGLWDLRVGSEMLTLDGHSFPVSTLQFSFDGKVLASGGWDGKVCLWKTN